MPKTKVVNQTDSSISLKEGTAGVYRTVCSNLQPNGVYSIKVDPNATYREYWCAVPLDDDKHVVLSSDDCVEYEEVHIKLKADKTYTWDALKRHSRELVPNAGDKDASKQAPGGTGGTGGTGGVANPREAGAVGKWWNKVKGWFS